MTRPECARRALGPVDAVGVALVAALSAVVILSSIMTGTSPGPFVGAVALAVTSYALGRLVSATRVALGPVIGGSCALVGLVSPDALSGELANGPLRYGNANGALFAQAAAAAAFGCLGASTTTRFLSLGLTALLSVTCWLTGSVTAAVLVVPILVAATAVTLRRTGRGRARGVAAGIAAVLVVAVVTATVKLSEEYGNMPVRGGRPQRLADLPEPLAELLLVRVDLWWAAIRMAGEHPLTGAGAGAFATTATDEDLSYAHSLPFQTAADFGWAAAVILLVLALWVLVRLAASGSAATYIGIAGFTAFAAQTAVDYVAAFPVVTALAMLVAGMATGRESPGLRRPPQ